MDTIMELILKLIPATTSALFALGGTGFKWARRFLLPVCVTIVLLMGSKSHWLSLLVGLLLIGSMHLPYGDSLKGFAWVRYIVFATFFAPFLLLAITPWILVSYLITSGLFIVSNSKWGEKLVPHWCWEPIVGFLVGICTITC
jgi:hypothetical protein